MEVKRNRIIKDIAVFVLDNQKETINFLNESGYANLSPNSSRKEINKSIAYHMFNERFWFAFVEFMQDSKNEYSNWVVAAVKIVSTIATSVNKMFIDAKMALFGRNMAWRQDQRNKETEEFYKELAELNAKKQMSINLNVAQQKVLLEREKEEERGKTIKYVLMFGLFVAGAFTIAYLTKPTKK